VKATWAGFVLDGVAAEMDIRVDELREGFGCRLAAGRQNESGSEIA
jgi:hypothetical protein